MCVRCLCCCCCSIFFALFLLIASILSLYIFVHPRMPSYSIENFDVRSFEIKSDNKLQAEVAVDVKAHNPNDGIAFEYEKDSEVNIIYSGSSICSGKIPVFFQPVKNTTNINIVLKGQSDFGEDMQQDLMQHSKAGHVTLLIKVKVPVRIVVLDIRLRELVVNVNGTLVVDNFAPDGKIKILSSKYEYDVRL